MNGQNNLGERSPLQEVAGKYTLQEWLRALNRRAGRNRDRVELAAIILGEILTLKRNASCGSLKSGRQGSRPR
jgi:hypothetical protein